MQKNIANKHNLLVQVSVSVVTLLLMLANSLPIKSGGSDQIDQLFAIKDVSLKDVFEQKSHINLNLLSLYKKAQIGFNQTSLFANELITVLQVKIHNNYIANVITQNLQPYCSLVTNIIPIRAGPALI